MSNPVQTTPIYPKHPLALSPGRSGAFELSPGDHFIYDVDGRRGRADEFTSDGDAYVCWDDGTYDIIKWNHMSPEPKTVIEDLQTTESRLNLILAIRSEWNWQRPCRDAARDLLARATEQAAYQERLCADIEARAAALGIKL